jgi:hypothetical protein
MEPEGSLPHSQAPATCPYPEPNQSNPCLPHPISWSILILSSHLRLCLPSSLFPPGLPHKTPLSRPTTLLPLRATCPAHFVLVHSIAQTIFGEVHRWRNCSLRSFLYSPVTSCLLGWNIFLSTPCEYLAKRQPVHLLRSVTRAAL